MNRFEKRSEIPNTEGRILLKLAMQHGHFSMTCSLVENGADLNATDARNQTIIYKVACYGTMSILRFELIDEPDRHGNTAPSLTQMRDSGDGDRALCNAGAIG